MNALKLERTLLIAGFTLQAVGLLSIVVYPEAYALIGIFYGASIIIFLWLFAVRRRRKRSGLPSAEQNGQPLWLRLITLLILAGVTLSGPWWLPSTGTQLDFPQRIVIAVFSCIFCTGVYLFAWWRSTKA